MALVHDPSYVDKVKTFCERGGGALDLDTFVSSASWEAALTAAGGVRALIEELRDDQGSTGFALSRPPGHHAMPDRAMGFCLFNNVAVAAAYLRSHGERVAILDWDVHHGNGTQEMLSDDPGVLYVSIHQDHFYPYAGYAEDIDVGEAKGTVVNVPLPAGTAGDVYREAWDDLVLPIVSQFAPDWVLVSAGFDAHANDHLADFYLVAADYGTMAAGLASVHPVNRTIFALEGGYDLTALRESARSALLGLSGVISKDGFSYSSPPSSRVALTNAVDVIRRHWRI